MITMNDIDVILSISMSPVYTNALVLFNGKSLPAFLNLSMPSITYIYKHIQNNNTYKYNIHYVHVHTAQLR